MSLNASSPISHRQYFRYPPTVTRRKGLLRGILILSTLFVLTFCGTMMLLIFFLEDSNGGGCERCSGNDVPENGRFISDGCREICTTEGCMKTAADMINRMDTTADPCNDFHRFSCGKYDKISMGKERREQFMTEAAEAVIPVVAEIIQNIPKHLPEDVPGHSASKVRNFYDSCVSLHSTEEIAVPSILKYLEYFGIKSWPHLNPHYEFTSPDLNEAITRLALYDSNVFFRYEIPDNNLNTNTTENNEFDCPLSIKVKPSRKALLRVSFTDEDVDELIGDVLEDFGMSYESLNETMVEAFGFNSALELIQKRSRKRIRKCTLNATISCSAYQFDCSNERSFETDRWCQIAVKILNDTGLREKYPYFNVILEDKVYFRDITTLIESTTARAIAHTLALDLFLRNFIIMNYRFRRISRSSGSLKELLEKFQEERKFLCVSWTMSQLPALLGEVFYSKVYRGKLQKEADDICSDARKYLIKYLRKMTWMDKDVRESLEDLIGSVRITLNDYLPYISDGSELDEYFKTLQITDESFVSNMMEVKRFRYASHILYHHNNSVVFNREKLTFQFNPNYIGEVIGMDFSSFIYPLIAKDRPRYSNLGFFGSFLAHEFSHGVEMFLRDLENISSAFENSLKKKKQCLIDQYSEYEIDLIETKVNGSFTLHENMADFFSIRSTYQALKSYQKTHGPQRALPGLRFNEEQMFFISHAQWWCEKNTLKTIRRYTEDNHSPGKYRVVGMMKNFEPFSAAFNCPLGSPMNPVEKCNF